VWGSPECYWRHSLVRGHRTAELRAQSKEDARRGSKSEARQTEGRAGQAQTDGGREQEGRSPVQTREDS
jgi:hypothetical protein